MSILDRLSSAITAYVTYREAKKTGDLASIEPDGIAVDKDDIREAEHSTRLKVYHQEESSLLTPLFLGIQSLADKARKIPVRGTLEYAYWLDKTWKEEPILTGAVYSMVAKMQSLTWRIEGGRNNASQAARMLSDAMSMSGRSYYGFMGATAIDFYTQDNGVFLDVTRQDGDEWGKIVGLAHIDSRNCLMTGNAAKPMYYRSTITSDEHWYRPGEFIHFASMPSPIESDLGLGLCAASRAVRAAKLLMALHSYDAEKLSNLPPEGIGVVTGLTYKEFTQAIQLWMAERKKNNSLTFPQVLWLVANNASTKIDIDIKSFSSIPESFDRQTVVSQYVNTLALDFGVDTREFWAISTGALGTASETEVQHMKAKGKGGGEFLTLMEASLNAEFPDDVTLKYDTQDIEEDAVAAAVAKQWIDAYLLLLYPPKPEFEAVLDAETIKRMLADKGVIPEWVMSDKRIAIESYTIHKDKDELADVVRFVWRLGRLMEVPVISLKDVVRKKDDTAKLVYPVVEPVIRGAPIADEEVDRGARVTTESIKALKKWWGEIPELAAHA